MKSMQLTKDNILDFLKFVKGGEYTYDPDGVSYVYCTLADINVKFSDYAVYDNEDDEKIFIWNEEVYNLYTIPPKVIELIRMLNVIFPYMREGVAVFAIIDDLTNGEYDVIHRDGVYEMDDYTFKLKRKDLKFSASMIDE